MHRKLSDDRAWYVDSTWWREQENGLFFAERSVYQSHRELVVEIAVRPYTSYLKVNIILNNVICKESFDFYYFYGDFKVLSDLLNELDSHLFREDGSKKQI